MKRAFGVFALALAVRLAFLLLLDQPLLFQHQYTYFTSALRIAEHPHPLAYVLGSEDWRTWDGRWTIAPLYYLFAGAVFRVFGPHLLPLQLLQCLLDSLAAVGVGVLGRRAAGRWGFLAGVAYACFWPTFETPSWTMTENLHTPLLIGGLVVLSGEPARRGERRSLLAGGFLLGLSALARSVSSAFLGLLALLRLRQDGFRRGLLPAALLLIGGALPVAPWLVRNLWIGQPAMIETAAYENLWWANHLGDKERFRRQQAVVAGLPTPEEQRRAALHFALKGIRERPDRFADKVVANFWHFLRPDWLDSLLRVERPGPGWQYAAGILLEDLPLILSVPLFLVFLMAGRASPVRTLIATWTVYYLLMIVVVFHNELRYRSALMPLAFAGAAGGVAVLLDRQRRRRVVALAGLALGVWLSYRMAWPYVVQGARAVDLSRALAPAWTALDRGELAASQQAVAATAARDPRSSRPWLVDGRRLLAAGHLEEAIDAYRKAASTGRPAAGWIPTLVLPRLLAESGQTEQATAALREADSFSWSTDPWLALETAWAELPPPVTDEIRLGDNDYGAVRGFLHPRGGDPAVRRGSQLGRWDGIGTPPPPGTHRWSRHRAWLRLVPKTVASSYQVTLHMGSPTPSPLATQEVSVRIGDDPPTRFTLTSQIRPYALRATARAGAPLLVRLDAPTWNRAGEPAEQGVRVDRMTVSPAPQ